MFNTKAIRRIETKANKIDRKQEAMQKNIEVFFEQLDKRLDGIEKKLTELLEVRQGGCCEKECTEEKVESSYASQENNDKTQLSYGEVLDQWLNGEGDKK